MKKKPSIILFYVAIALFAVGILWVSNYLRQGGKQVGQKALAAQSVEIHTLEEVENPITLTNQDGEAFDLASLRGKVWSVNAFFASCPQCVDNYQDHLVQIHKHYRENPDFHMVSISVDPRDTPERVRENLSALDIDFSRWTFLMGDQKEVRAFLEQDLGFASTQEREGEDAAELGAFAHDMGLMVVDKEMKVRLKRDLFMAGQQAPELLPAYREAVIQTVGALLQGKDARPRGKAEAEYDKSSKIRVQSGAPIDL